MKISLYRFSAKSALAAFLISSGTNPGVAQNVSNNAATSLPGVATPAATGTGTNSASNATSAPLSDAQRRAGDAAWDAVQTSARAAGSAKVTKINGAVAASRTEAEKMKAERAARAKKLREVAQRAKEFQTQHPQHPQFGAARKMEVLSDLEGILPTDRVHRQAAEAKAQAFRSDSSRPLADRMAVADAMEHRAIQLKLPGHAWTKNPVLAETMLDRMKGEFGDRPEIWARYLNLAENTYCDAGRDVAHRIVQSPVAAEATKAAARRILERYALVRKPLDFAVTPAQGRPTTLAQLAGKTTVIVLWDGTKLPGGPPGLTDYQQNPRPNTTWVYISLGDLGPKPKSRADSKNPPGVICVEPASRTGPAAKVLQPSLLPYAFVLDEQKRLSGYGRVDEIPALIAGIGRRELR